MFIILLFLMIFCIYMLFRNIAVFNYRRKLLDQVSELAHIDVHQGKNWKWRLNYFESVSYDEMMFKFYKPLGSFYPDKSFIESNKN